VEGHRAKHADEGSDPAEGGSCSASVRSASSPTVCESAVGSRSRAGLGLGADSDGSASTRADSSEVAPIRPLGTATTTTTTAKWGIEARRLMQQMGWRPEASANNKEAAAPLDGAEVAAWRERHPRYRQAVREERLRLRTKFELWAGDNAADTQDDAAAVPGADGAAGI